MDVFENPDLVRQILPFTGRLPRHATVSRVFHDVSEALVPEQIEYMNRNYPLWNAQVDMFPENMRVDISREFGVRSRAWHIINEIALYHLQRAAINSDWDVFRAIVEYHKDNIYTVQAALYIAHINNRDDIGLQLFRLYGRQYPMSDAGYYGIVRYYRVLDNPIILDDRDFIGTFRYREGGAIYPQAIREKILTDQRVREFLGDDPIRLAILSGIMPPQFEILEPDDYRRLWIEHKSNTLTIPELIRVFTFKEVINRITDDDFRNEATERWKDDVIGIAKDTQFFNLYMIQEFDRFFSVPENHQYDDPIAFDVKPILLKGSRTVWEDLQQFIQVYPGGVVRLNSIIREPISRLVYLQRTGQPISVDAILNTLTQV